MKLQPAVAATRLAVRRCLDSPVRPAEVLVACSGGPDSLALAAATAFVAPRLGIRAGLATVDHGLQEGSAARAAAVVDWGVSIGLDPVSVETVTVDGPGGPEAAARAVRYAALTDAAKRQGAELILLGHTLDDQAETVLLALARGAGPRGLAAMPARRGSYVRPFLDISRTDTRAACAALGLAVWDDPHNADPAFARSRLRSLLPMLEEALGHGITANLARTARLLAADNAVLDTLAEELLNSAAAPSGDPAAAGALDVGPLAAAQPAVRTRSLHLWAARLGVPGAALSSRHVDALDGLVTDWHGQGPTYLPGGLTIGRRDNQLIAYPPD